MTWHQVLFRMKLILAGKWLHLKKYMGWYKDTHEYDGIPRSTNHMSIEIVEDNEENRYKAKTVKASFVRHAIDFTFDFMKPKETTLILTEDLLAINESLIRRKE